MTPTGPPPPRPWREAWHDALYGPAGFYRESLGPAGHFTTSSHGPAGEVLAEAMVRLAEREGLTTIVDVGCGRGELLSAIARIAPDTTRLVGVDVVERPEGLDDRVRWHRSPGGTGLPAATGWVDDPARTLVIANEWLDVVPCTIARAGADGILRELLVDEDGTESHGAPLTGEDLDWARRWWPAGPDGYPPGARVEIGRSRDAAFAALLARFPRGLIVVMDYGHSRATRPEGGSLTGYANGVQCPPVPDGRCDLTAHVATDSLGADSVTTQRAALRDLGVSGARPPIELARTDPAGYLRALARASYAASLTGPGLGDFHWAMARAPRG